MSPMPYDLRKAHAARMKEQDRINAETEQSVAAAREERKAATGAPENKARTPATEDKAGTFDVSKATKPELQAEAERRGITVTRADGEDGEPLVSDYRAALGGG